MDLLDLFSQQLTKNDEARTRAQERTDTEISGSEGSNPASGSDKKEGEGEAAVKAASSIVIVPAAKRIESKYFNSALSADGTTRLAVLVQRFVECSKLDGRYYLCDHANLLLVSNWLHTIPLSLPERSASPCCYLIDVWCSSYSTPAHVQSSTSSH